MDRDAARDDILVAALPNVAFDGWSCATMREGAEAAGHDADTLHRAFPGGVEEFVEHFGDWVIRRTLEATAEPPLSDLRVRDRIRVLVKVYFGVLEPHREAQRRLMAWLALPQHVGLGARLLARTVDEMWRAAGDQATDVSFYTKRALLGSVLAATTLYWLDDGSEGHEDTWAFLDRRLADVMGIGRAAARLRDVPSVLMAMPNPLRFARQMRKRCGAYVGAPPPVAG